MTSSKLEDVKQLQLNDKILLSDGSELRFIKLKRPKTKFYARDEQGECYTCVVSIFVRRLEPAPPESALIQAMKRECRKWFRQEIGTAYGPSDVIGFTEDEEFVKLKEFGEERYDLSLDDFLQQLVDYNGVEIHVVAVDPDSKYSVELTSVGNPDFGQSPSRPKADALVNRTIGVSSLEEAAAACREFIQSGGLGGGNWTGGKVIELIREHQVAYVSYNGRIWATDADGEVQKYAKMYFSVEDEQRIVGYTAKEYWNGFSRPYFPKESAEKVVALHSSAAFPAWYDADKDTYCFQMQENDPTSIDEFAGMDITVDGQTIRVWPIGNGSWTWMEHESKV